jgi:hypothetical protein
MGPMTEALHHPTLKHNDKPPRAKQAWPLRQIARQSPHIPKSLPPQDSAFTASPIKWNNKAVWEGKIPMGDT